MKPKIIVREIDDTYAKKNFEQLKKYFDEDDVLNGFQFIEFKTTQAETNLKIAHGLGFRPKDIIKLKIVGPGVLTFNHSEFDTRSLDISTTDAVRVRILVGTFQRDKSREAESDDETEEYSAAVGSTTTATPATTGGTVDLSGLSGNPYEVFRIPGAGGSPAFGAIDLSQSAAVAGVLDILNGGTGQTTAFAAFNALSPMSVLGDMIYGFTGGQANRLPGTLSTSRQFLSQISLTGLTSAAPSWVSLGPSDIPDLDFARITTGVVPIAQGGTGQTTANAGFKALSPMTTLGDLIFMDTGATPNLLAGNITTTRKFLRQVGTGAASAAPAWDTIQVGDLPTAATSDLSAALVWRISSLYPPVEADLNGVDYFDYDSASTSYADAVIVVPPGYVAGTQFLFKGLHMFSAGSSGGAIIRCNTALLKTGYDISSFVDVHTSVNTQVTLTGSHLLDSVGNIDLTDGSGMINGTAVAPGDILVVQLFRDYGAESGGLSGAVSVLRQSGGVAFS